VHLPPPCRWCGAVAVVKFATFGGSTQQAPLSALRDRPRFSCALHFPAMLAGLASELVAVDSDFTAAAAAAAAPADDETRPFPPIGGTVRRRPPVPPPAEVKDLQGAELLRALADEMERQGFDVADLDDDGADQ
jgi:hypothetical protein